VCKDTATRDWLILELAERFPFDDVSQVHWAGCRAGFVDEIKVPIWAVSPLTPLHTVFRTARADIQMRDSPDDFCGTHLWLEALFGKETYGLAPRLSQIIADGARSTRPKPWADSLTTYSIMWHYWSACRIAYPDAYGGRGLALREDFLNALTRPSTTQDLLEMGFASLSAHVRRPSTDDATSTQIDVHRPPVPFRQGHLPPPSMLPT
jgi:hypothetical protein